ncbi:MAG: M20/M25/M40 family metallo-hydrolase [Sinobacteraceae bacterium]|nr:M20/M25/M40 family metallo-hydrolase [Nevskiaceae bacterium]MBV9316746.1 M20/M25/M40 family metallo-hydrolase [Gammaproteobacteria bacterium]MBV9725090.1 M20/M25/M40 family metallo-hydrolase [Gammaproteobacteria bacterium]
MKKLPGIMLASLLGLCAGATAHAQERSGEAGFRELYKELVETNTTLSAGDCTLAAERMAAHLKRAGFADDELHVLTAPGHPKEGALVAVYAGREPQLKALLLLAHIDVVEAKREDWTRDPFTLVEENGRFYARGAVDDKAEAAIWVDTLVRLREQHYRPRRTLKLALTCGEETAGAFNGAEWLTANHRDLLDAGFALNEGARGELDAAGKRVALEIQAGEKTPQNYRLEVTNPGGHSSLPVKDNAIYHLAGALKKIEAYTFPAQFTDANRAYFSGMAKIQAARGEAAIASAMETLVRNPADEEAIALVSAKDPGWNATLRTTCVATMLEAGHATNALPQRARANINCRIFPGVTQEAVRSKLEELVADPAVHVITLETRGPSSRPPPLTREVLAPFEKLATQFWPGVPVLPILQPGATDGQFLNAAGIPTYGIEPLFLGPDFGHIHGLNEYVGVTSLLECRDFLFRLVKVYAEQK